jgi:hypothetical protein
MRAQAPAAAASPRRAEPVAVAVDLSRLRRVHPRDLALRFAFGAAVSLLAGLVALRFGPRLGGVFLAFPAVLPASLTLIEAKEGRLKALADAKGGQIGAAGMIAFALTAAALLPVAPVGLVLAAALAVWSAVAIGLYALLRRAAPRVWGEDGE